MSENQKQLLWQCRRGMLEVEILLTDFLHYDFSSLDNEEQANFEELLTITDPLLYEYLMGSIACDSEQLDHIIQKIRHAARERGRTFYST